MPVEQPIRTFPEAYTFMKLLDHADQVKGLFQSKQFWIKRLLPNSLNERQELPPPPPFL